MEPDKLQTVAHKQGEVDAELGVMVVEMPLGMMATVGDGADAMVRTTCFG